MHPSRAWQKGCVLLGHVVIHDDWTNHVALLTGSEE